MKTIYMLFLIALPLFQVWACWQKIGSKLPERTWTRAKAIFGTMIVLATFFFGFAYHALLIQP